MKRNLRWISFAPAVLFVFLAMGNANAQDKEWVSLFDGKTIDGWEKVGNEKSVWLVGAMVLARSV